MAANADDLRYYYSEALGDSKETTCNDGVSTELTTEKLVPGRYEVRVNDFGGATELWLRSGKRGGTTAAAASPSTRIKANAALLGLPLIRVMARGSDDLSIAVLAVGGNAHVQITRISR